MITTLTRLSTDSGLDREEVERSARLAVATWSGTRNETFVRASGGAQAQLRLPGPAASKVAAALGEYERALSRAQEDIAELEEEAQRLLGITPLTPNGPAPRPAEPPNVPTDQAAIERQVEALRQQAASRRSTLLTTIDAVGREIDAATATVAPGTGATTSPEDVRAAVTGSYGLPALPAPGEPRSRTQLDQAVAAAADAVPASAVRPDGSLDPIAASEPGHAPPAQGSPPDQVKQWWDGLSEPQRHAVEDSQSALVGNLDGIPAEVRDKINRSRLEPEKKRLQARIDALGPRPAADYIPGGAVGSVVPNPEAVAWDRRHDMLATQLQGTQDLQNKLIAQEGAEPPLYLLGLDNESSRFGRAIVSSGNPDTADRVATFVPGTGTTLSHGAGTDLDRAITMQQAATREQAAGDPAASASIMWLGYDPPFIDHGVSVTEPASKRWAANGASALVDFQAGLRVTHEGPRSINTVIGHSYGTTTIGWAASHDNTLDADNLVFIASPGVTVKTVDELQLTSGPARGRVFATASGGDNVVPEFGDTALGGSPTNDGVYTDSTPFDATIFASDNAGGHSDYWSAANEGLAMKSVGLIIDGHGDQVEPPPDPVPYPIGGGF